MANIRIGNSTVSVEGIRPLKQGVEVNDQLKTQLSKDGLDSIIFKKGDELFIAYQKNMKLDNVNLNLDAKTFDVNSAYDAGQLSVDGDAVQVLHVDDENKDSFWVAPYKSLASGVKSMVNDPDGKAFILGFAGGAVTTVIGKNLDVSKGEWGDKILNPTHRKIWQGTMIGTSVGAVAGGLKASAERDFNGPGGLIAGAVGYGVGAAAGWGGNALFHVAKENPKVAAITVGVTAAVVGTGIALDLISDNNKPATYRVINQIADK
jgi:hypothetical protein